MIVLGLTGSIAMGKSTAADAFRRLGVPVHDADAAVHRLMDEGGEAAPALARAYPAAVRPDGGIDRAALREAVLEDARSLRQLETILHPLVRKSERAFLARARKRREALVVLDIPLLYETGAERRCDAVAVVSAPLMQDAEKRRRADFVIPTGLGKRDSLRAIRRIVTMARDGRMPRRRRRG